MCLQSCHRAVITDRAVLLSFSLIKVDMKPQPAQISELLCSVSSAASKHVTGAREIIPAQVKIKDWALWGLWCAARHCLSPRGLFINSAGGQPLFPPINLFISSSHRSDPFFNAAHTVIKLFFCFLINLLGVEPDKPPGDPAAGVLALH